MRNNEVENQHREKFIVNNNGNIRVLFSKNKVSEYLEEVFEDKLDRIFPPSKGAIVDYYSNLIKVYKVAEDELETNHFFDAEKRFDSTKQRISQQRSKNEKIKTVNQKAERKEHYECLKKEFENEN